MKSKILGLLAVGLLACGAAHAVHVTALPGSTTFGFGNEDYFGAGPKAVAAGITWSSSYASSVYGYDNGYGFNDNGEWGAGLSMIGTNGPTQTMRIDFASPVAGVGAFMNYALFNGSPNGNPPVIAVYDSSNTLLESYTLSFGPLGNNAVNDGQFHGFLRGVADISYMTFSGAYIGAANLEVVRNSVPEPGTLALLGLGLAGLAARRRRRTQCG